MKLTDFIRFQNKELVESAHITFKLFLPENMGGKWFFYCNEGDTVEDLCKWVVENKLNLDITWSYNDFSIEEDGEAKDGRPIIKYVFRQENYPKELVD